MKSYFFVPANRPEFLNNIPRIDADHFIIDLEDSISHSDIRLSVRNATGIAGFRNHFYRLYFDPQEPVDQLVYLLPLLREGVTQYVIPKIEDPEQLKRVIEYLQDKMPDPNPARFVLLIESPRALLNLGEFIQNPMVVSVGLGSHDYCSRMGMEHNDQNLLWARMYLLNYAKAYSKEAIDIASMNISDYGLFASECRWSAGAGFEAKFIIHPEQLRVLNETIYYSEKELDLAVKVRDYIRSIGGPGSFVLINIDGTVVEKNHLERLSKILKMSGNESF